MLVFKCLGHPTASSSRSSPHRQELDAAKHIHLIVDNYGTHNHPNVRSSLGKHPRFTLHFIPTSSSWLNPLERWFRELTDKAIRRGSFARVADLIAAIEEYIAHHNADPKPDKWTKTAGGDHREGAPWQSRPATAGRLNRAAKPGQCTVRGRMHSA
jgi:transposase